MIKVGLCGKIAAGKSEAEKILRDKGFLVVDLDEVSHLLLEDNEAVRCKILEEFHTLERKELAKIVFNDNLKRARLEEIIYPVLREKILDFFNENNNEKMLFVSGALLYEAGFDCLFDEIIFVDAPLDIRLERLMKRNNFSKEEAMKRINSQMNGFEYNTGLIINNNAGLDNLQKEVERVLKELKTDGEKSSKMA